MPRLFHDALVLPVDDRRPFFRGWLLADDDGLIAGLGEGEPPAEVWGAADDRVDLGGAFLAPGFISAHSHLFTSGMRGFTPDSTLYPWVASQVEFIAGADAEDLYWFTLHGSFDVLAAGTTSAYNFTDSRFAGRYDPDLDRRVVLAERPPAYTERQVEACRDAGLRTMSAFRLDPDLQDLDTAFEVFAGAVEHVRDSVPAALSLDASVFGAAQWSDDPTQAAHEVTVMDRHGVGNQAHLLETAEALDQQRIKVQHYADAGALRPGFLFGHFVHADDATAAMVADSGAGMVWQPCSNGRLGSGIADVARNLELDMPVGMGLDDQSCTDAADPFQNMRIGMFSLRALRSDAAVMSPSTVLRLHTLASAEALGVADRVGSLEVGKHADLLVVDPKRPDTGPVWDPVSHYVLAMTQRNLVSVWSGGVEVARDGACLDPLAERAVTELHARAATVGAKLGRFPAA
ncbi:MAG: amidohydrolase family protein [Acidimicrobiales bacterium]